MCGDPDQGVDPGCLLSLYACASHFRAVFWIGLPAIKCSATLPPVPRSSHSLERAVTGLRLRLLSQAAGRAERFAFYRLSKSHGSPRIRSGRLLGRSINALAWTSTEASRSLGGGQILMRTYEQTTLTHAPPILLRPLQIRTFQTHARRNRTSTVLAVTYMMHRWR
jgi:hypothetical protein